MKIFPDDIAGLIMIGTFILMLVFYWLLKKYNIDPFKANAIALIIVFSLVFSADYIINYLD